jgi:hypothetical protein
MRIERQGPSARLTLDRNELRLLRYALERASFIDTIASEQPRIANFCSRALDLLPRSERAGPSLGGSDRAREPEAVCDRPPAWAQ